MFLSINKKKSKKNKSKSYLVFFDIAFIFILIVLVIIFLAMKNNGYKDIKYVIDDNLTKNLIHKMFNDEEICLTQNEFNSILNNVLINKQNLPEEIKSVSIVPQKNKKCEIFIPYRYKNIDLEISLIADLKFNENKNGLELKLLKARVGQLPMPKSIVLNKLKYLHIINNDDVIFIKTEKTVNLFNKKIELKITEFNFDDQNFFIKLKINNETLKNNIIKTISSLFNVY